MAEYVTSGLVLALVLCACGGKTVDLDRPPSSDPAGETGGVHGTPPPLTVFKAREYEDVFDLAVDSKRLYWVSGRHSLNTLRGCIADDCLGTELTYPTGDVSIGHAIHSIRVHADTLYWLAQDTPAEVSIEEDSFFNIWSCAVTGCSEPQLVAADVGRSSFEIDAKEVIIGSRSAKGFLACPISGCEGPPRKLPEWGEDGPSPYEAPGFADGGESLFWLRSGKLFRQMKDGASPPKQVAAGLDFASTPVARAGHVYWAVPLLAGSIGSCSDDCTQPEPLLAGLRRPRRLIVTEAELIFQHQTQTGDWEIASCPVESCAEPHAIGMFSNVLSGANLTDAAMPVNQAYVYVATPPPDPIQQFPIRIQRFRR
jgi:hypothetical protein